jgi:hypothetical protein
VSFARVEPGVNGDGTLYIAGNYMVYDNILRVEAERDLINAAHSQALAEAVKSKVEGMKKNSYPFMCRMDHPQIGYDESGDDERCPLCFMRDERDTFRSEVVSLKGRCNEILGDREMVTKKCRELEEAVEKAVQQFKDQHKWEIEEHERLNNIISNKCIEMEKAEKPIREVLFAHGYCGDGNLRDMVERALKEAGPRHTTQAFKIIQEISDMCGDIEGTLVERVKKLLAKAVREAMERAANRINAEAKAIPMGEAFHGGPLDDTPKYDVFRFAEELIRMELASLIPAEGKAEGGKGNG